MSSGHERRRLRCFSRSRSQRKAIGQANMTTWKRGLARSAWTAFLVLFAAQAVAGRAQCELYGDHGAPPAAWQAVESDGHLLHGVSGVRSHERPQADDIRRPPPEEVKETWGGPALPREVSSPAQQPSQDGAGHACEEPVYLTGEQTSPSPVKSSLAGDPLRWSQPPARDWRPAAVALIFPLPQMAHPPPSRAPLCISSRLRI